MTPKGLGRDGRRVWREITTAYDLRADEVRVLEDACREIDLIERIEAELRDAPLMVKGSQGQLVASPLVSEVRQHRAILARLFNQLRLPESDAVAGAASARSSASARELAMSRWGRRGA